MPTKRQLHGRLKCNFCGSRKTTKDLRCCGCGGSSFSQRKSKVSVTNENHKMVYELLRTQNNLKYTIITLAIGVIAIALFSYRQISSVQPEKPAARQSIVEFSKNEIQQILANAITEDYEFIFVESKTSTKEIQTTNLHIEENANPLVLVLSSFEAVHWHILNPHNVDIRAIVFGSTKIGSKITGHSSQQLPHKGKIELITSKRCEGINMGSIPVDVTNQLDGFGTGVLSGISISTHNQDIRVPESIIDERYAQEVQRMSDSCPKPHTQTGTIERAVLLQTSRQPDR